MKKYLICLEGCDDTTKCEIELTKEEFDTFIKISKQINKKSTYQCKPHISIYEKWDKDEDGYISYYDYEDILEGEKE